MNIQGESTLNTCIHPHSPAADNLGGQKIDICINLISNVYYQHQHDYKRGFVFQSGIPLTKDETTLMVPNVDFGFGHKSDIGPYT